MVRLAVLPAVPDTPNTHSGALSTPPDTPDTSDTPNTPGASGGLDMLDVLVDMLPDASPDASSDVPDVGDVPGGRDVLSDFLADVLSVPESPTYYDDVIVGKTGPFDLGDLQAIREEDEE